MDTIYWPSALNPTTPEDKDEIDAMISSEQGNQDYSFPHTKQELISLMDSSTDILPYTGLSNSSCCPDTK